MRDLTDTFDRSYDAIPASVPRVRADISAFAAAYRVEATRIDDIRLAISEAVTNAVMHGYRDTSGTVHVAARYADGSLWISIRDFGCGMQPRSGDARHTGMGLGLALIGRVVSELSVAPQAGSGTEVRMRFDLVSNDLLSAGAPDERRARVG